MLFTPLPRLGRELGGQDSRVPDLGVSEIEVVEIFRKSLLVICTSLEKCTEIKRFLLATGRFEMVDLFSDPSTLMCSVEKRCKLGLQILKVLKGEGLIRKWPRLSSICRWRFGGFLGHLLGLMQISLVKSLLKSIASREK